MPRRIHAPADAPTAVGPYSQAVEIHGFLFCAGQIPIDPATGALVNDNATVATERVLKNVGALLRSAGLDYKDVVKATVFLKDLNDFAAMNEVYARYFTADFPARSTVQAAALPKGAKVEIEAVAHY